MTKNWCKKGITLVETIVASAVLSTLMLGIIPPSVKMIQQKAVQTTAQELIAIQEAEKNHWIDKLNNEGRGEWASSIDVLKTRGYIPSTWSGQNLFGNNYTVSTTTSTCRVQTTIPKGLEGVIQTNCPQVNVSYSGKNAIVSSTIPIPGQEPTMEALLHRTGDVSFRTAEEPIGIKKYLVVGEGLKELEDKIDDGDIELKEKDIYVKELQTKGVSSSGWLSDAQFPAKIDTEKVILFCPGYLFNPWVPISGKTVRFPKTVKVLEKIAWPPPLPPTSEWQESSDECWKSYTVSTIHTLEANFTNKIYMKFQTSDGNIYDFYWTVWLGGDNTYHGQITFSSNVVLWDILPHIGYQSSGFLSPCSIAYIPVWDTTLGVRFQ